MMKKTFTKFIVVLFMLVFASFRGFSEAIPTVIIIAESVSSGDWNSPATWSTARVPNDSAFVIINSGHTVTLSTNSTCESLVIEKNAMLDNGAFELLVQFNGWAHGRIMPGIDDGINSIDYPYAPIDSTWDITNANNANWNLYIVNGTHAGTGNIIFSFLDGVANRNDYGATASGYGSVTNTGSIYYESTPSSGRGFKFNSACDLKFYGNVNLFNFTLGGSGITSENFGKITMKGNTNFTAACDFGTFNNIAGACITLENGSFYSNDPAYTWGLIYNFGTLDIKNGNLYLPFGYFDNYGTVKVGGNMIGPDAAYQCYFMQDAAGCVFEIGGDLFPATNNGFFLSVVEPNYVVYNGTVTQLVNEPIDMNDPALTTPFSILKLANKGTKELVTNIRVNDSLLIADSAQLSTSINSYGISMNNSSVWKNTGVYPLSANSSEVIFSGTGSQSIISTSASGESFYKLTINNASGVTISAQNVSVTNTLDLQSGLVTLGNSNLTLGSAASILGTPSASTMIVADGNGELRKAFSATGSFTFPVGDNTGTTEYAPVTLNFISGTFTDAYVGVNLVNQAYPGVTGNYLNRYWNISSSGVSGINCNAQFGYPVADVVGTESQLFAAQITNTSVNYFDAANTTLHQLTANSLVNLGAFTGTQVVADKDLNLSLFLEGLYKGGNLMNQARDVSGPKYGTGIADYITVELHNAANYNVVEYTYNNIELMTDGTAHISVSIGLHGSYFITIKHRNSIQTVSSTSVSFSGSIINYGFDAPAKVFGGNLNQYTDGVYTLYSGDLNQDGMINSSDNILLGNNAAIFKTGYLTTDINGDGTVDSGDMTIIDNNSHASVTSVTP